MIEVTAHAHPDPIHPGSGFCTYTYRWIGPELTSTVDFRALPATQKGLKVGDSFLLGELRLIVVDVNFGWQRYTVAQSTRFAAWYIARAWTIRHWQMFKTRLIATLAIWGLAKYDWVAYPQWSDVYFVDRILKWSRSLGSRN